MKKTTKKTTKKGIVSDTKKAIKSIFGVRETEKLKAASRAFRLNPTQEAADAILPFVLKRVNAARKALGYDPLPSLCSGMRWSENADPIAVSLQPIVRFYTSKHIVLSSTISAADEKKVARAFDRTRVTKDYLPTPVEFRAFQDAFDLGMYPALEL
jgi:hypothetical protein